MTFLLRSGRRGSLFIAFALVSVLSHASNHRPSVVGELVSSTTRSLDAPAASAVQRSAARSKPIHRFSRSLPGTTPELVELMEHNRRSVPPLRNGFSRPLPTRARLKLAVSGSAVLDQATPYGDGFLSGGPQGSRIWTAAVEVDGAWRLRLALDVKKLPSAARFWIGGSGAQSATPFGRELLDPSGRLWTPSAAGPIVTLTIELPLAAGEVDLEIAEVSQLFELDARGQPRLDSAPRDDDSCLRDAQCFSSADFSAIEEARKAVAWISFQDGGGSFICSGGLLNDTDTSTSIPFFLTANHCFDSQASATSLEAYWDYTSNSCDGSTPPIGSLPRSNGSTLLATNVSHDYTLVRLNSIPGERWFLGWDPNPVASGTNLYRISHPLGRPQSFSRATLASTGNFCPSLPQSNFLYSTTNLGGTLGGSSGSPVMRDNGQVVGQLFGACGPNPSDGCDYRNLDVDGALSGFWDVVQVWLSPSPGCDYRLHVPNGGENWLRGVGQTIEWSSTGLDCAAMVSIDLYRGDSFQQSLSAATENDGEFAWTVPTDLEQDTTYAIRVTDADDRDEFDQSDAGFTVLSPGEDSDDELRNLSTRSDVGTGSRKAIAGFIISGSSEKCVVVRGRGPSVGTPNASQRLADPVVELKAGGTTLYINDDWQRQSQSGDAALISSLGLAPGQPLESALYRCLAPGAYTALLSGFGNSTGIGLVEVIDVDLASSYLRNISTRANVGSGDLVAIVGFIISGDQPKRILIRGRGPSIAINRVRRLADPRLRLFDAGNNRLASNDNWEEADNATEILGTGRAPVDPSESALLLELNPGIYTAILDGVGGTAGIGIVEVLDLTGR